MTSRANPVPRHSPAVSVLGNRARVGEENDAGMNGNCEEKSQGGTVKNDDDEEI